jgi:hypothetical protein
MPRVFYYITEQKRVPDETYKLTSIHPQLPAMIVPAPKQQYQR